MVGQRVRIGDDEFQHIAEEKYWQDCLKGEIIYFTRSKYCLILKGGQTATVHLVSVKLKKKLNLLIICSMINHTSHVVGIAVLWHLSAVFFNCNTLFFQMELKWHKRIMVCRGRQNIFSGELFKLENLFSGRFRWESKYSDPI